MVHHGRKFVVHGGHFILQFIKLIFSGNIFLHEFDEVGNRCIDRLYFGIQLVMKFV